MAAQGSALVLSTFRLRSYCWGLSGGRRTQPGLSRDWGAEGTSGHTAVMDGGNSDCVLLLRVWGRAGVTKLSPHRGCLLGEFPFVQKRSSPESRLRISSCVGSAQDPWACRWPNPQPTSPQKDRPKTTRWLLGRWGASEGTERGGLSGVLLRDLLQWQEREEGSTQGCLPRVLSLQDRVDMACLRPVCVTSPSSAAADVRDTMGDSHWTALEHPMLL